MKTIARLFFVFQLSFFIFHLSEAQIIHVPQDYPTIQEAVNAAEFGDTVLVAPGNYLENIQMSGNGKILTLASHFLISGDTNDINNTIIDASQPQNPNFGMGIMLKNMDSTMIPKVTGFTVTGGTGYYKTYGGGIYASNAPVVITDNRITDCSITGVQPRGGGIYVNCPHPAKMNFIRNNMITNCSITYASNMVEPWGAGVAVFQSHVIIEGNTISENHITGNEVSQGGGGGICVFLDGTTFAQVIIKKNLITGNSIDNWDASGGGLIVSDIGGSAVIQILGNTISSNACTSIGANGDAKGAGIYIFNPAGGMTISENTISDNNANNGPEGSEQFGGGIYVELSVPVIPEATPLIEKNIITGNSADQGGGMIILARGSRVVNNFISGNLAGTDGAGIYYFGIMDDLMITECVNNTITGNTVTGQPGSGGGIYVKNSPRAIFMNDLFYGNTAEVAHEIKNFNSTVAVYYCDINTSEIDGPWSGENNFYADPELVDGMVWDCADPGPCWDAGTGSFDIFDTTIYAPASCIQGNIRPLDQAVDVGACEVELCTEMKEVGGRWSAVIAYPNPTTGIVDIRFTVYDLRWVSLKIYNAQGQEVATLLDEMWSGNKVVRWDASRQPTGIYYYRLTTDPSSRKTGLRTGRRPTTGMGKIVKY